MFHNSTTIWHKPHAIPSAFREKRTVNGVWSSLKFMGAQAMEAGGKAKYKMGKILNSKPVRYTFPVAGAWSLTGKAARKGYEKGEYGFEYGKEVGKSVVGKENSLGRALFEPAYAPVEMMKHGLLYNTRDIISGVFSTTANVASKAVTTTFGFLKKLVTVPANAILHPLRTLGQITDKVTGTVSSVRSKVSSVFANPSLGKFAKGVRSKVGSVLSAPTRLADKALGAISASPVAQNCKNAVMSYPKAIENYFIHGRGAIHRVLNAHHTASANMAASKIKTQQDLAAISAAAHA